MRFLPHLRSFGFAWQGIRTFLQTQTNARFHLLAMSAVLVGAWYCDFERVEWFVLLLTISMVLVAEAFNTALEFLVDLVSPEYHPLAGKVKDVAAGAVLIAAVGAAVIGFLLFAPHIAAAIHIR